MHIPGSATRLLTVVFGGSLGNTYSLSNPYDRPARIFFSQGCYMTEEEGEAFEDRNPFAAADGTAAGAEKE